MKAAFFVNPRAGCGIRYNMIGSDTIDISRCGQSESKSLALSFLSLIRNYNDEFLTASGAMGEDYLEKTPGLRYSVIYSADDKTDSSDTENFLEAAKAEKPDVLVFVGGDGTASVVCQYGWDGPVIAVPAGTKMFSSVFPVNVKRAAEIFNSLKRHGYPNLRWGEVVDIDDDRDKEKQFKMRLMGYLKVPDSENIIPVSKAETDGETEDEVIGCFASSLDSGTYILGPGNTTKAIMSEIGLKGTVHGFDIVIGKSLAIKDASREDILANAGEARLVLSPLGKQGFILGRGNRQVDAPIVEKIGFNRIILLATHRKLEGLETLYFDIPGYRGAIPEFLKVITGCGRFKLLRTKF